MYIIINALKNVKRNLSRNILMFVILLMVIIGSVVALSIKSAASTITEEYRESLGANAILEVNEAKFKGQKMEPMIISMDQYNKLMASEFVRSYKLSTSMAVEGENLKGKDAADPDSEASKNVGMVGVGDNGEAVHYDNIPSIKLLGASSTDGSPFADFASGRRAITQGRTVEKDGEGLVSEEFAQINNLKVGDVIKLSNPVRPSAGQLEITIVGIYKDVTTEYASTIMPIAYMNRRNEILTTFDTTREFYSTESATINADFSLRSPDDLEPFRQFVREIGITDDYNISVDEAAYNQAVGPLETLDTTMTYFIIVMLIVTCGVLLFLSMLSIRERQYEIGVLRAMGMKKISIAFSFVIESLSILFISLIIGIAIGTVVSNPIANNLLHQQISDVNNNSVAADPSVLGSSIIKDNKEKVDAVNEISVQINYIVILQLAALGIVLVLFSNLVAISYIMKFEPMEIMRKRN